jgi:hypothetical protein
VNAKDCGYEKEKPISGLLDSAVIKAQILSVVQRNK